MPNDLTRPYHDGGIDTTELHRLAAQAASAYGLQSVGGSAYYYHGAAGGIAIPGAPEATLTGTFETGTLTGNQNDYALPPGAGWLQAEPSSAIDWTGFSGGAEGRVLRLTNTGTATLTLRHQDSSSSAANRIITPDGLSYAVAAGESAVLIYDAEDQRWRVQDRIASSVPVASGARVYRSTDELDVGNLAAEVIAFDNEQFDTSSYHDNTTNNSRLTVPSAGVYLLGANIALTPDVPIASTMTVAIRLNGTTNIVHVQQLDDVASVVHFNLSTLWQASASDYFEVTVDASGAGGASVAALASVEPVFWITRIGT